MQRSSGVPQWKVLQFPNVGAFGALAGMLQVEVIWWNAHMVGRDLEHQREPCCLSAVC